MIDAKVIGYEEEKRSRPIVRVGDFGTVVKRGAWFSAYDNNGEILSTTKSGYATLIKRAFGLSRDEWDFAQ